VTKEPKVALSLTVLKAKALATLLDLDVESDDVKDLQTALLARIDQLA
jgi:hypothetical protein